MSPGHAPEHLFEHPDAIDQFVQIHARVDAHPLQHMHDILGRRHAGRLAGTAIRTAADAADRGLQTKCVTGVQRSDRRVRGGDRHPPCIVQVTAEVVDIRPALLDLPQNLFDLLWMAPAHRIANAHLDHLDARVVPQSVLLLQKLHHHFDGEVAHEVRAECRVDADACFLGTLLLRGGDGRGPGRHLLQLRTVGVSPDENIAHVAKQLRAAAHPPVRTLDRQRRGIFLRALHAFRVQGQGEIGHPGFGMKLVHDLVDMLHLRRVLGAHE